MIFAPIVDVLPATRPNGKESPRFTPKGRGLWALHVAQGWQAVSCVQELVWSLLLPPCLATQWASESNRKRYAINSLSRL